MPSAAWTIIRSIVNTVRPVGHLLREWRQRRRLSQLALACEAEISTRHLSFLETGRSLPSREMILHLAEQLNIPLRERNVLMMAAGYAPTFAERPLDDPALRLARRAIDLVLAGHEPYPALAVDRHWTLVASNKAIAPLVSGVSPELLRPPINVLRLGLHPNGIVPRIINFPAWRSHLIARLRHQIDVTADPTLKQLISELLGYPMPSKMTKSAPGPEEYAGVVVPLQLATEDGVLSLFSTTTVFGTPVDITLAELALESFFPADAGTAEILRRLAGEPRQKANSQQSIVDSQETANRECD
jgi:transcriptional regulator with XRE-family HTH domain